MSDMIRCSSWISNPSNRTGSVTRTASHDGARNRRLASAYIMTATASPIRCWEMVTRARLWNGLSSHRYSP